MGKSQQLIKLFVVLLFSTAFIFSFSHYGAKAFEKITNANGKFSDGTTIGSLDVSGKTEIEAKSLLEEKYLEWLKDTSFNLQYGEKTAPFDVNQFHLDAKQTVNSIKDSQKNPAFITIDRLQVVEQVENLFPQLKSSDINLEKLSSSLNETALLLEAGSHTFNLYEDYLLAEHIKKDVVINTAVIDMKQVPNDLQTLIENNPSIEIPEESTFSVLEFAKKHKITDSDALNIIATGIYQAALPTDLVIEERNISSSLPDYASLGYEAKVDQSRNSDLVIANRNKAKYKLELKLDNGSLTVTIKGEEFVYNYKITTKDEQKLKPKTIIQYSPLLLPGKTKVQIKGAEGIIVKVYRDVYQGDSFIKSVLIAEDYYPPVYQVEVHGLAGSQQSVTEPSGTTNTQTGTDNNGQTNEPANTNGNQTPANSDNRQQDSSDSDLWGKPNEQPK
ncbi:G5 domain-containing protein [Neobacillus sp. NPDC093127]|uniref:G5 domain-containing protein n=1 Tax=Neobacillus sp. NPDC093127 TaxID=3364296 RepID=UPI00382CC370